MTEEQDLLQRLQNGEVPALEQAIRQYSAYVATVIQHQLGRFASKADTEELCADVFFALWQWRGRLETEHLRGWLGSTARNRARDFLRKQRLDTTEAEDWLTVSDDTAARLLEAQERNAILKEALDALEPDTREMFIRYYYYNETTAEIASTLETSRTLVKNRLARGRQKLKEILIQGGYDFEA